MNGELMSAEMAEQPRVLAALAARREELAEQVRSIVPEPLAGVVLVARGSSDYAAVYGRYLVEITARRPVALAAPSLVTLYGARTDLRGYLAVGVSQSGRTPEIRDVLAELGSGGARTVAITNEADSPLAATADVTLALGAGEERAVPATKTLTAQLAAFAVLAEALGDAPWQPDAWSRLPETVAAVLADDAAPARACAALGAADRLVAIGRGLTMAAAFEAALKLRETTGMLAEGWSAADYRHGPIAATGAGVPALAVRARGPAEADVVDLVGALRARGATVVEIADDERADLPVPPGLPEALVAIPAVVRAQQLARAMTLARGLDPDAPAGLAKVTPT
jgi:glucosamine--fructose-6-phosphate aminotransferase (isomerizing)